MEKEVPQFNHSSKIWSPTSWELRKLISSSNRNKEEMSRNILGRFPPNGFVVSSIQDQSLRTFLFKLTRRRDIYCINHHQLMEFREEDALNLCSMLRREGYFDVNNDNGCAICATEKLERSILKQMQREMEVTKKARNYFAQTENAKYYKLCLKHRPFDPNDTLPKCYHDCRYHFPQPILPAINFCVQALKTDSYVPIPLGENPINYMLTFNDWVTYLALGGNIRPRMSYTNNISIQKDNLNQKD